MKLAADTKTEYDNVPMRGKLNAIQKDGSYAVLEVPEDFCNSIFKSIYRPGMIKPDKKPHISVMTDEELEMVGKIREHGQEFEFFLESVESCEPKDWEEVEKVYFVQCRSPQLEHLRKRYGLSEKMNGDHEFHITIAVKPKKKSAGVVERLAASELRRIERMNEFDF